MATTWKRYVKDLSPAYDYYLKEFNELADNPECLKQIYDIRDELSSGSNIEISKENMLEFLAQYAIIEPIVTSIYSADIPILQNLNGLIQSIKPFDGLEQCYDAILSQVNAVEDYKEKDLILMDMIEVIFKNLKNLDQEKYGIVYTPPEVVDFINHSVQDIIAKEFGMSLTDETVKVIDPFAGTGIFLNRMLQDPELIPDDKIDNFYHNQICAFEIMPLSCLMSKLSISNTYNKRTGKAPFMPVVHLMDTFAV